MILRLFMGWLVFVVTALLPWAVRGDDTLWVGSWNLRVVDTEHVDLVQYGELHVSDHAPVPLQHLLTGRIIVNPWKHLGFCLGYSFISQENYSAAAQDWDDKATHRFEVEVNPRLELAGNVRLSLRNRIEERWIENKPGTYPRSRHRLEVAVPLKNAGPVSEVFTFVEPFFDWRTGRHSETRVAPLGVTLKLSERASLRTFYVWQSVQAASGWADNHMIWTQWVITLD